jgi:intein/homing endonuclease
MNEIKNLERILEELEYFNTSILTKLEKFEKKGIIKDLELLIKRVKNAEETLEKWEEINLVTKTIFYAILADSNLVKKTIEIAKIFNDNEVINFLNHYKRGEK